MFRDHYIGGIVSYAVFFGVSMAVTQSGKFILEKPLDWNPIVPVKLTEIAICFAIAILASIWPDVDIKSTSQVIFYRLIRSCKYRSNFPENVCLFSLLGILCHATHARKTPRLDTFENHHALAPSYFNHSTILSSK